MVVGPTPLLASERLEHVYQFRIELIDFRNCLALLHLPEFDDNATAEQSLRQVRADERDSLRAEWIKPTSDLLAANLFGSRDFHTSGMGEQEKFGEIGLALEQCGNVVAEQCRILAVDHAEDRRGRRRAKTIWPRRRPVPARVALAGANRGGLKL